MFDFQSILCYYYCMKYTLQNQDGTYSLRFPRFVRFRGFEPGEKL
jgi:hypothetical protein